MLSACVFFFFFRFLFYIIFPSLLRFCSLFVCVVLFFVFLDKAKIVGIIFGLKIKKKREIKNEEKAENCESNK